MALSKHMRDTLILIKEDGSRIDGIKGLVTGSNINIHRTDIHIEPGDELHRAMPGGKFDAYVVIEPGFHQGLGGIPAGYNAKVKRKKQIASNSETSASTLNTSYHFYGDNARVNNNSTDNSSNLVIAEGYYKQLIDVIADARLELNNTSGLLESDKKTAEATLAVVETQAKSKEPSMPVMKAILSALPDVVKVLPSVVKLFELFKG